MLIDFPKYDSTKKILPFLWMISNRIINSLKKQIDKAKI